MRTYPLQIVIEGRLVSLLVWSSRGLAFGFVDGTPLGRIDLDVDRVTLQTSIAARCARAGLDPARVATELRDAIEVEASARRALDAASRLGERERARAWMRAAAEQEAARAGAASGRDHDLAERIAARVGELALRFA